MRTPVTVDPATTEQLAPRFPVPYSETCQGPLVRSTRRETCPVSTEGGTRRVQLVREGGRGEGVCADE